MTVMMVTMVLGSAAWCAGDLALLQHDKPLAKGNSAPHLKHIPAYLTDPTIATPSFPGNAGKGTHTGHLSGSVYTTHMGKEAGVGGGGGGRLGGGSQIKKILFFLAGGDKA